MNLFQVLFELARLFLACLPHRFAFHLAVVMGHIAHGWHVIANAVIVTGAGLQFVGEPVWLLVSLSLWIVAGAELILLLWVTACGFLKSIGKMRELVQKLKQKP